MAYSISQLGTTFQNLMYDILCGGDGRVPPSNDSFLSWCSPGLPYTERDFDFIVDGIGSAGSVVDAAGNGAPANGSSGGAGTGTGTGTGTATATAPAGATTEQKAAAVRRNWEHAYNLATQLDFIPNVKACYGDDQQQGVYTPNGDIRLSVMYKRILDAARVVDEKLTDAQQKQLDRLRSKLRVTREVEDLINGGTKKVVEDSPLLKAYKDYQAKAWNAQLQYNSRRVAAATGVDPVAINDFGFNGQVYAAQFAAAVDEWEANGYKGDVEGIHGRIDALTKQSMAGWRSQLQQIFANATLTTPVGMAFPYTTLIPGDFASAPGWTTYKMHHEVVDSKTHSSATDWSAGATVTWCFWASGGAKGSSQSFSSDYAVDSFELSFEMTQATIARPGFTPEFLLNRGWDLKKGTGWTFDGMPSDGGDPPEGLFVGYPVQAIFVRNVKIKSDSFASHLDQYSSSVGGSASIGWGPFCISGSYGHRESDEKFHSDREGNEITIPGMQLICFRNHLLGKTPNLLDGITEDQLI